MTDVVLERKTSRLDLRMTDSQKLQIEAAAQIDGVSVSQWSIAHLIESARNTIASQSIMRLSSESFDRFAQLLDEPVSPDFASFAQGTTRWD